MILIIFTFWENKGKVEVIDLETTGVLIEGITYFNNLIYLCKKKKVSDLILKEFKFLKNNCSSVTIVENDNDRYYAFRNNKYLLIFFFLILFERIL